MTTPERELGLHRFLDRLYSRLRDGRDPEKVCRAALRETARFLGADAGALVAATPGGALPEPGFAFPRGWTWDAAELANGLDGRLPHDETSLLLAPIERKERRWRAMALGYASVRPREAERAELRRITRAVSEILGRIDRERVVEVRWRIDRKIMEQLRPKDLFYQILHGLRSLTGYDHSSALLIAGENEDALTLVAEQIAWRKGKSDRIGQRLPLSAELRSRIVTGEVSGFDRVDGEWRGWTEGATRDLAELVDFGGDSCADRTELPEGCMLCAPLSTGDGVVGVLKISGRERGELGSWEAALIRRFTPQVSVAIQNSRRTEALQAEMLDTEKKAAMATLARSVVHDVNNALGAVLPLVQQLREDSAADRLSREVLDEDLGRIESSLNVCRRIFGGMLAFARQPARGPGRGNVAKAVDGACTILADGFSRRGIRCEISMPDGLPAIRAHQGDLEQLFFNLMSNAGDAMTQGGVLRVQAQPVDSNVSVCVEDTGCGIPEADLARIQEPFFTTKPRGKGLGLAICRSILWSLRSELSIESREGRGTAIRLTLPCAVDPVAESAR